MNWNVLMQKWLQSRDRQSCASTSSALMLFPVVVIIATPTRACLETTQQHECRVASSAHELMVVCFTHQVVSGRPACQVGQQGAASKCTGIHITGVHITCIHITLQCLKAPQKGRTSSRPDACIMLTVSLSSQSVAFLIPCCKHNIAAHKGR